MSKNDFWLINKSNSHTCDFKKQNIKNGTLFAVIKEIPFDTKDIKANMFIKLAKNNYGIILSYPKAYNALRAYKYNKIKKDENFCKIPNLVEEIKKSGNYCHLNAHEKSFKSFFICYKNSIDSFKYCLPIIALDACHIKSKLGGMIFCCSTLDGSGSLVLWLMVFIQLKI